MSASHLYPQDGKIANFFKAVDNNTNDLLLAISELTQASTNGILQFWNVIMKDLLKIICNANALDKSRVALRALLNLLVVVHGDSRKRHAIVVNSVQTFNCNLADTTTRPVHEAITSLWLEVMRLKVCLKQ
jgi:hypothetical protein